MLALVPAGLLVLVLLAALAVDSAVAYLGQQQLHDALSAAANDAVAAAVSGPSFYGRGVVSLDSVQAERDVCFSVLAQGSTSLHHLRLWVAVGGDSIRVVGQAAVDSVFGRAIPGFGHHQVRSSADAVLASGPLNGARGPAAAERLGPVVPVSCVPTANGGG